MTPVLVKQRLPFLAARPRAARGVVLAALFVLGSVVGPRVEAHGPEVLVFSKTAGFRHDSIPAGIAALEQLGHAHHFEVVASEDAALFTAAGLADFAAIVLLQTTGDFLDEAGQDALQAYVRSGGGVVAIHAALDAEEAWPWYGAMLGARFSDHPAVRPATVLVLDRHHPSTAALPERWVWTDEWYNFPVNPRGAVHVLATVDESTYAGGTMGHDHPIAWCHEFEGGRVWYTTLGHSASAYADPAFLGHLLGGIEWAAGVAPADAGATIHARMERVVLEANVTNPMALEVAEDGSVFFIERGGSVKRHDPDTGLTATVAQLPVHTGGEDGLLGIALDPGFLGNGWIYLYHSPFGPVAENVLSRFTFANDAFVPGSERVLLRVPTQRDECCHSGGGMEFGPDGVLHLATGDNTNPYASDDYAPIDERPGRSAWDAQRTSGNTDDLRGKILRIRPEPDGTYSIPGGNLFPPGTPGTRPEIFVMGARNPFRFAIDPDTGDVIWGDIGPDATADSATRGSRGFDEINRSSGPGNHGWPFFIGDDRAYRDFNFATGVAGALFNPAAPVNDSPNNTGLVDLPPVRGPLVWYAGGAVTGFPALDGGVGRAIMPAAIHRHDPATASDPALPAYFDRALFASEWARNRLYTIQTDAAGAPLAITEFAPTLGVRRAIDLAFGPDGALYLLEWGNGFAGNNADARLSRIAYNPGNKTPVIVATAHPTSGPAPLLVHFDAGASYDPDPGDTLFFAWDFDADGTIDATVADPTHAYAVAGNFLASVRVSDSRGRSATRTFEISAGNTAPVVTFTSPPDGGFFDWGDAIDWSVRVDDAEDGSTTTGAIAAGAVVVDTLLGHANHGHGIAQTTGLHGTAVASNNHAFGDDLFLAIEASYTDAGAPAVAPATGIGTIILQPKTRQAGHFTAASGVTTAATGDPAGGGLDVRSADHGDRLSFFPMNLLGITEVGFRYATVVSGARIDVRADAPDGPLLASVPLPPSVGPGVYREAFAPIVDPGGTRELHFVFQRNPGDVDLAHLNWITFRGPGVSSVRRAPRVSAVRASAAAGSIVVEFDERMDAASLGDPARYAIDGLAITAAFPAADLRSVVLATAPFPAGRGRVLALEGVRDLAGDPIAPGTRVPFLPLVDVLAINCGGPAYVSAEGVGHLADQSFSGGTAFADDRPIAGTVDDPLYQTERFGAFGYAIPLPAGEYFVTLSFAEIFFTAPGQRVFSILLEGLPVVSHLDVFARAGALAAHDVTVPISVVDGVLNLVSIAVVENPKLSAIRITRAPPPFTDFASWRVFHFGPSPGAGTTALEDPDGDGLSNLLEYALGGDPNHLDASAIRPRLAVEGRDPAVLTLSYRKARPGLVYRVVTGTSLEAEDWSEAGVGPEVYFAPADLHRRSVPMPAGEPRRFLRLEVEE